MSLDYSINDFICQRSNKDMEARNIVSLSRFDVYVLNRDTVIFDKENKQGDAPVYVHIDKDLDLSAYLTKISKYLDWLGGECKNNLTEYFFENTKNETISGDEWYNELEVYCVTLTIDDKRINAGISCVDYKDRILDLKIDEKDIKSIDYYED